MTVAFLVAWAVLVLGLIGGAAAMERSAIRQRINGANGLVFLVAGVLGLLSVPVGGAVTWYLGGLGTALVAMAVALVLVMGLWMTLMKRLSALGKAQGGQG